MDDLNTISLIAWLALFATLGTLLMVWWAMSAMATLFVCSAPSFDEPKESGTAALTPTSILYSRQPATRAESGLSEPLHP